MNRSLVVASVVFTGFFICLTLPANSHIPGPLKHPLVAHLTFPVLILLLLRMNPIHNGLGIGNWRKGLWLSFLASIAVLLSCFLFAKVPAMQWLGIPVSGPSAVPAVRCLRPGREPDSGHPVCRHAHAQAAGGAVRILSVCLAPGLPGQKERLSLVRCLRSLVTWILVGSLYRYRKQRIDPVFVKTSGEPNHQGEIR